MEAYGKVTGEGGWDERYEYPDYPQALKLLNERKYMTLHLCWDWYIRRCTTERKKAYQYRRFREFYGK